MENKYYTPTIEEFYVGFECETNYCLFVKDTISNNFESLTLTKDNIALFHDSYENDTYTTEFRVKYLDKEDIESFGFNVDKSYKTLMCDSEPYLIDYQFNLKGDHFDYKLLYCNWWVYANKNNATEYRLVKILKSGTISNDYDVIFSGDIKNKSQLNQLLKQLGIFK